MRVPNGEWVPDLSLQNLDGYQVHWRPRDKEAPCFVVREPGAHRWWDSYFVARRVGDRVELMKSRSKTAALNTARDLNRDPDGEVAAFTRCALKGRGYAPGDVVLYDSALWRVIGGGPKRAVCQFLFAFDGQERDRTDTSRIRWESLERFTLQRLGQLYMELGTFIKGEAARHAHAGRKEEKEEKEHGGAPPSSGPAPRALWARPALRLHPQGRRVTFMRGAVYLATPTMVWYRHVQPL